MAGIQWMLSQHLCFLVLIYDFSMKSVSLLDWFRYVLLWIFISALRPKPSFLSLTWLLGRSKAGRELLPPDRLSTCWCHTQEHLVAVEQAKRSDFKQLKPTVPECRVGSAWYMSSISHKLDCLHSHWGFIGLEWPGRFFAVSGFWWVLSSLLLCWIFT